MRYVPATFPRISLLLHSITPESFPFRVSLEPRSVRRPRAFPVASPPLQIHLTADLTPTTTRHVLHRAGNMTTRKVPIHLSGRSSSRKASFLSEQCCYLHLCCVYCLSLALVWSQRLAGTTSMTRQLTIDPSSATGKLSNVSTNGAHLHYSASQQQTFLSHANILPRKSGYLMPVFRQKLLPQTSAR